METKNSTTKSFDQNEYHELEILKSVHEESHLNNRKAATKLGVSVKLAHTILNRMVKKGLLNIQKENSRKWHYFLTPTGLLEQARLTVSFFDFSMQFYKDTRKLSAQLCRDLAESDKKNVVLLGTGELAEVVYLGVQEWNLNLVDVIDLENDNSKFMGIKTVKINEINQHDAIIICLYNPLQPMEKDYLPEGIKLNQKMVWIFS
jgi:predicted transcriptional regulator